MEALAEFRRALALRPDFAEARLNLGKTLNLCKWHEEAAALFQDAVVRQPDSPYALLGLGRALTALDQHRQAIKCLRVAVRLGPELAELMRRSALHCVTLGRRRRPASGSRPPSN
jgi:protein O-GlcNAc transferase